MMDRDIEDTTLRPDACYACGAPLEDDSWFVQVREDPFGAADICSDCYHRGDHLDE